MTAPASPAVIASTSNLTPDGVLGYAKFIVAGIAAVIVSVVPFLPEGEWQRYAQIALAVLGAIGVLLVPNAVKHVVTVPVDEAQARDVQVDTVQLPVNPDPEPVLGVVLPPERGEPGGHEGDRPLG